MSMHSFLIDVSGACNLRCPSCPVGNMKAADFSEKGARSKGFMKFPEFEKIINKIVSESKQYGYIPDVHFYNWGEPLINPDIIKMIALVNACGVNSHISTNFNVNIDLNDFVKNHPHWMRVSLSGWRSESYKKSHVGGDLNLVKSNLYKLRYFMDKHSISFPVDVLYHCYKDNLDDEISNAQKEIEDLGFNFRISYAYFMGFEKLIKYSQGIELPPDDTETQRRMLVAVQEGLLIGRFDTSPHCPLRGNQTVINWDGSVPLCCVTYDSEHLITHSFLDGSFEEIQNNKSMLDNVCDACVSNGIKGYALFSPKHIWNAVVKEKLISQNSKVMLNI